MQEKRIKNGWLDNLSTSDLERMVASALADQDKLQNELARYDQTTGAGYSRGKSIKRDINALQRDIVGYRKILASRKNPMQTKNPEARNLGELKFKVASKQYGLPIDQLTMREAKLMNKYARHFENDGGYIKIAFKEKTRRNARGGAGVADLVERFTLGDSEFSIYEPNTKRGKPFLLTVKYPIFDGRIIHADLGFFTTVEAARKKANLLYKRGIKKPKRNISPELQDAIDSEKERAQKDAEKIEAISTAAQNPQRVSYDENKGFALHKVMIDGKKYSAYYEADGTLKDAERIDARGNSFGRIGKAALEQLKRMGRVYRNGATAQNPREKKFIVLIHDKKGVEPSQEKIVYAKTQTEAKNKVRGGLRYLGLNVSRYILKVVQEKENAKRNASNELYNAHKLDELSGMFQGEISGEQIETVGSNYTPAVTSRLGQLSLLKVNNGGDIYEITFSGDAWLSMDARKNLHISGKNARIRNAKKPRDGNLTLLGTLEQFNYITAKRHIENGELVEYFHEVGEVDGVKPNVFIDRDGFPLIYGGNYDIGINGVEN